MGTINGIGGLTFPDTSDFYKKKAVIGKCRLKDRPSGERSPLGPLPSMPNCIITHATNKNHHPRTPDLPAPCCSSQVTQEKCTAQQVVHIAARHQQQKNVCQAAEIEDQLHTQMDKQCTNFQNPTSAVTRLLKPQPKLKTAPNGAILMVPTSHYVPGHIDNGES